MPHTMSTMQPTRATVSDSPKKTMPKMAAPTAPMPVQTAYAVPTGSCRSANPSSQKLRPAAMSVIVVNKCLVKPCEAFMLMAQTISSRPAATRSSHATFEVILEIIEVLDFALRESKRLGRHFFDFRRARCFAVLPRITSLPFPLDGNGTFACSIAAAISALMSECANVLADSNLT